jgi:hypothetical protein
VLYNQKPRVAGERGTSKERVNHQNDVIALLQNQINQKREEMDSFIKAINHCCSNTQLIKSITEARDLLQLLKDVSDE